jgi:hypothetical protein
MRYWLDTEFAEDGHLIHLISIGIVCEDGREMYCEVAGFDWSLANLWVRENVRPNMWARGSPIEQIEVWDKFEAGGGVGGLMDREGIVREMVRFCDPKQHGRPEFWGYYADYDWVVLCQLFGAMVELPGGWPMYCRDIKQLCDDLGNPRLPPQGKGEHSAIFDARWNKLAWDWLREYEGSDEHLKRVPHVGDPHLSCYAADRGAAARGER